MLKTAPAPSRVPGIGEIWRLADGRFVRLEEEFPDGGFGCSVMAALDAKFLDDWIELDPPDFVGAAFLRTFGQARPPQ